ncbi:MAG: hypothetical protein ACEY26_00590 [Candidatus Hodgkinia cicadicola]
MRMKFAELNQVKVKLNAPNVWKVERTEFNAELCTLVFSSAQFGNVWEVLSNHRGTYRLKIWLIWDDELTDWGERRFVHLTKRLGNAAEAEVNDLTSDECESIAYKFDINRYNLDLATEGRCIRPHRARSTDA